MGDQDNNCEDAELLDGTNREHRQNTKDDVVRDDFESVGRAGLTETLRYSLLHWQRDGGFTDSIHQVEHVLGAHKHNDDRK